MKSLYILTILLVLGVASAFAQLDSIGITKTLALGEVTAMDATAKILTLKTKDGDIVVTLAATTDFKKASTEAPADLTKATPATLTDIGVGDRLVASGKIAEDKKSMVSRTIILMTKGDISKIHQADSEAWTRGINGKVSGINPINKEISVVTRGMMGERTIVISDTSKTKFRRYAPSSIKFSDAVDGNYDDVKTGDQLRARGTRSDDGSRFTAEEIVSGTFRTAAGAITAIDAAKNQITISDVVTKKAVIISLGESTTLRKFPADMAQMFAARQAMGGGAQQGGGAGGPAGQPGAGGQRPQGPPQGQPQAGGTGNPQGGQPGQGGQRGPGGPGGGMGGMRGGNIDDMLERLPAITLAELKVGDSIAVSSTPGTSPDHVSAIKLLAGVEAFLTVQAMAGQGGGRQSASSPSINIPGLDGIGGP